MNWVFESFAVLPLLIIGVGILLSYLFKARESAAIDILIRSAQVNAVVAIVTSVYLMLHPQHTLDIWIHRGLGISIQQDALSLILTVMISILGMSILSFSVNYLDGDNRRLIFIRRVTVTTFFALLLVTAGNLALFLVAWVGTSFTLNKLLLYYKDRARAQIPARKKVILARLSDLFLVLAFWQIYLYFGTGQLSEIQTVILAGSVSGFTIKLATIFIAMAACLKSAQFPFHGWLVEVMESPTPVSALLHAGILNAGPFLVLRFSFFFALTGTSSLLLIVIGGFTAIYASTVLMTQPAIKTMLGYSSAAHMGFSLFLCGTGAYSAALLHLIGHSFYKAYTFLSSGTIAKNEFLADARTRSIKSHAISMVSLVLGALVYSGMLLLFGHSLFNQPFWSVGYIVILGISLFISTAIAKEMLVKRILVAVTVSAAICAIFFSLEHWVHLINSSVLPFSSKVSPIVILVYTAFFLIYLMVIWAQATGFRIKRGMPLFIFYIHLRNGFYVNTWFDQIVGTYKILNKKD